MTSLSETFGAASQSVVTTAQDEAAQALSTVLLNSGDPAVGSSSWFFSESPVAALPSLSVAAATAGATVGGGTYEIDPVVSRTLAELEEKMSHPPSLRVPVPEGKGLAQPLTESMERAFQQYQQQQQLATNGAAPVDPYVKVGYGFEVKTSLLEQLHSLEAVVDAYRTQMASEVQENVVPMVAANNAALAQQLYANADALQHATADQWTALSVQLQQVSSSNSDNTAWSEAWNVLSPQSEALKGWHLDELGGWYAGAFLGFLLLAVYKKDGASTAARGKGGAVGMGARRATSTKSKKPFKAGDDEKERLESMVAELTQAVNALSVELRELRSEKAATDFALRSVQDQVQTVVEGGTSSTAIVMDNKSKNSEDGGLRAQWEATIAENKMLQSQLDAAKYEVATLLEVNEALAEGINALDVQGGLKPRPPSTPPVKVERKKSKLFPNQNLFFFAK